MTKTQILALVTKISNTFRDKFVTSTELDTKIDDVVLKLSVITDGLIASYDMKTNKNSINSLSDIDLRGATLSNGVLELNTNGSQTNPHILYGRDFVNKPHTLIMRVIYDPADGVGTGFMLADHGDPYYSYRIGNNNTGGVFSVGCEVSSGDYYLSLTESEMNSRGIYIGDFFTFAYVVDRNERKLYINGELAKSQTATTDFAKIASQSTVLGIGQSPYKDNYSEGLRTKIKYIRFYSSTLTADAVRTITEYCDINL